MSLREGDNAVADQQTSDRQELLEQELKRFLDLLVGRADLERIIVFGSMATAQIQPWSDIDLVIVQHTQLEFLRRIHEARRLLRPRVATDILVYTPHEFEDLCRERRFFQEEIAGRGKVLYERSR